MNPDAMGLSDAWTLRPHKKGWRMASLKLGEDA
jgi:hypothetical protein